MNERHANSSHELHQAHKRNHAVEQAGWVGLAIGILIGAFMVLALVSASNGHALAKCAEDEYVRVDGQCIHAEVIERGDG